MLTPLTTAVAEALPVTVPVLLLVKVTKHWPGLPSRPHRRSRWCRCSTRPGQRAVGIGERDGHRGLDVDRREAEPLLRLDQHGELVVLAHAIHVVGIDADPSLLSGRRSAAHPAAVLEFDALADELAAALAVVHADVRLDGAVTRSDRVQVPQRDAVDHRVVADGENRVAAARALGGVEEDRADLLARARSDWCIRMLAFSIFMLEPFLMRKMIERSVHRRAAAVDHPVQVCRHQVGADHEVDDDHVVGRHRVEERRAQPPAPPDAMLFEKLFGVVRLVITWSAASPLTNVFQARELGEERGEIVVDADPVADRDRAVRHRIGDGRYGGREVVVGVGDARHRRAGGARAAHAELGEEHGVRGGEPAARAGQRDVPRVVDALEESGSVVHRIWVRRRVPALVEHVEEVGEAAIGLGPRRARGRREDDAVGAQLCARGQERANVGVVRHTDGEVLLDLRERGLRRRRGGEAQKENG